MKIQTWNSTLTADPEKGLKSRTPLKRGKPMKRVSKSFASTYDQTINWYEAVLERDNHQCKVCGKSTNDPPHHVWPKSTHGFWRFILENGVTLCLDCHRRVHDYKIDLLKYGIDKHAIKDLLLSGGGTTIE